MDISLYKIIITPIAYKEMFKIYDYISKELLNNKASFDLMNLVESTILQLKYYPYLYPKIKKVDELNREYRKIVIKNFVILYSIDNKFKIVYISHMYYKRKNYI